MAQIGAMTFDREGLRVVGIGWRSGELASVDPVDGTMRVDQKFPVVDSLRWPRGDFDFSSDGSRLAAPTQTDSSIVGVWDLALGRSVVRLRGSAGRVTAVAFSPDGQALASAAVGGPNGRPVVTLWHLASGRAIRSFESGPDQVLALGFSSDGRRLAAGGGTLPYVAGWITAWDAETGAVLGTLDSVGQVLFLAFHPDGVRIAIADWGLGQEKVRLWDLATGTLITRPGSKVVSCLRFTPDGKRLASLGFDGDVHLADGRTGDEVLVLRGFGEPIGGAGLHAADRLQPRRLPHRRQLRDQRPERVGPRPQVEGFGRTRGRRPRRLAAPELRPGRAGDVAGAVAAADAGRRDPGWGRVPLDRACGVARIAAATRPGAVPP